MNGNTVEFQSAKTSILYTLLGPAPNKVVELQPLRKPSFTIVFLMVAVIIILPMASSWFVQYPDLDDYAGTLWLSLLVLLPFTFVGIANRRESLVNNSLMTPAMHENAQTVLEKILAWEEQISGLDKDKMSVWKEDKLKKILNRSNRQKQQLRLYLAMPHQGPNPEYLSSDLQREVFVERSVFRGRYEKCWQVVNQLGRFYQKHAHLRA